jgi:uncharacterized membrane protein
MKFLNTTMEKIESGRALDPLSAPLAKAAGSVTEFDPVKDALSGGWLGHPLHPMLTDIPIGAWSMATLLDLTGGEESAAVAKRLVGIGVLSAMPTALSGVSDWSEVHGPAQRVGIVHALANSVGTSLQTASWLVRAKGHRKTGVLLSLAGLSAVGVGGYLGGHLTYAQGVGVKRTAAK